MFPLVLVSSFVDDVVVFRKRVENWWLLGGEAPIWI